MARKRKRKAKKRRRSPLRARVFRRRKKPMGLLGKAGVVVAGGIPVGWGIMDGGTGFWNTFQSGQYSPFEAIKHGLASFVDSVTCGFTGIKVFGSVDLVQQGGATSATPTYATAPAMGWVYTTFTGLMMAGLDFLMGKYLFKNATKKIFGVKLIGG